jgi:hypothetical protein
MSPDLDPPDGPRRRDGLGEEPDPALAAAPRDPDSERDLDPAPSPLTRRATDLGRRLTPSSFLRSVDARPVPPPAGPGPDAPIESSSPLPFDDSGAVEHQESEVASDAWAAAVATDEWAREVATDAWAREGASDGAPGAETDAPAPQAAAALMDEADSADPAHPFDPDARLPEPAAATAAAATAGMAEADTAARPPTGRPTPHVNPFRRRWVVPLAVVGAIAAGVFVASMGSVPPGRPPVGSPGASGAPTALDGYLVTIADLRDRAIQAQHGVAPVAEAAVDLRSWAETASARSPHPVQPLVVVGNDNVLTDDATRAYGLGLAYVMSGDERMATSAAATIRAWVEDVHWADDTCTDAGGCHTTLSISRTAAGFVFAATLIAGSPAWTSDDAAKFRSWLRTVILPAASERQNNWGDAGTFMRVVVSDYLGDQAAFSSAIAKWRSMLDLIEADGRIPEEARRGTDGISYTQEALQYKVAVARIAELRGIDLWGAVGAKGGSLKAALDRLAYFSTHPAEWPDAVDPEVPSPGPLWEIAYAHWPEPAWAPLVLAARPYGDRGHSAIRWTTLTNGIPIDPITAGGSPATSGAPSSSPADPPPSASPAGSPDPSPTPPASQPPVTATLTAIHVRLVDSAATGAVRVRVSWSAPAGADRARLEWSTGGSWSRLVDTDRVNSSTTDAHKPGTVSYRGRVTEHGLRGPWIELDDVVTARIDANAGSLTLSGSWSLAGGSGYRGGSALSTDQVGARATWHGTASDLLVIGPVGPTRGRLDVIVDGHLVDTVSLRADHYLARKVLASLHWDGTGEHEVVLRAASGSGRTVAIDELVRLESGSLSSPASTP